ncbi:MAG: methyl-accepting chemotaxis protein [Sporomusaceae bacterium]|nr:methyl-accepting chemotaxis protein [Sporomusaceae bacterium]
MEKLRALSGVMEIIRDVSAWDCSVLLCDAEAIILKYADAKTFPANVTIGEPAPGGLAKNAIETRKIATGIIPARVYGVPLKAICYPIIEEDGTISGVIGTATTLKVQEQLHTTAQAMAATSEEMAATTDELSKAAEKLAGNLTKAKSSGESVLGEINKTNDILRFVSDVASNSNLLGLNAAIEAARAGEHGRGFAVVAEEIRKMADNSSQSVRDIREILQNIQAEIRVVVEIVSQAAELGGNQLLATDQIRATMQDLANSAADIERVAEIA